ncbi:type IV pilus inner membrane component PilO [Candidatus Nitrosacidococcus tergens]|uniref:Pilus assembly protein PilO n=1 Tax=Candidatus Nitrosacidococcus tergens TaxID=553981 RepID=A0A7G1Q732_9GAMM|nr:type 4a pilus biogenesis protein PilO [Candidatus Nitrosacidococcus tergens]CAB1274234.1 Pilus assembly protein PilO [Candidatus Nitrosacidococcus tergens]
MDLDFNDIDNWSITTKIIFILCTCLIIAVGGYFIFTQDQIQQLKNLENQEQQLKASFQTRQLQASKLPNYKEEIGNLETSFNEMLHQLPDKAEISSLLTDISQAGKVSGLEFEFFRPGQEKIERFYAELSIQIQVLGHYHQFGEFISKVAALPHIVTFHNFSIKRGKADVLVMTATARTYRYLDDTERQANEADSIKKKNKL